MGAGLCVPCLTLDAWTHHRSTPRELPRPVCDRLAASEDAAVKWIGGVIVPAAFAARPSA